MSLSILGVKTLYMSNIITIRFNFLEHMYSFLARYKIQDNITEYHITVMDGTLEKLLYGNHIIKEKNGFLQIEISENNEQEKLKLKIGEALSEYLNLPLKKLLSLPMREMG